MSKRRNRNRPEHQILAQILLHSIGETTTPCQGDIHQREETPAQAEWEIRMYQDVDMMLDLMKRGVPREQINQKIWDAACKEQDTVGIVNHKTMYDTDSHDGLLMFTAFVAIKCAWLGEPLGPTSFFG